MKRYKLYFCFLISFITLQSCEKYLDKKTDTSLVVPKTLKDLQSLLDDNMMNHFTPAFMEEIADDFFVTNDAFNAYAKSAPYIWEEYTDGFGTDWAQSYKPIYNCNLVLELVEKIDKVTYNRVDWENVKGSALFFRAYHNLNLTWTFAKAYDKSTSQSDLGIVLRSGSDFNVPSVRSSVAESYQKVITDLEEAAQYLPDNPLNVYRPSKAATYGVLARAYLSMRNYPDAFKYADLSLKIKNSLLNYNSTEVLAGNTPFKPYPFNVEVVFYSQMSNSLSLKTPLNALIDSNLYTSYTLNDKRKTIFFRPNGVYQRFKGSYAGHTTSLFTGIATDELYLIRAEGHARAGRTEQALTDLNMLLQNRWVSGKFSPATATTAEQALALILNERRKELLMRGLRLMDLKRLNKEGANITLTRIINGKTYVLPPNDNRYVSPIPDDIIQLTGMPQNPR